MTREQISGGEGGPETLARLLMTTPVSREKVQNYLLQTNVEQEFVRITGVQPDAWRAFLTGVFNKACGSKNQLSYIDMVRGVRSQADIITTDEVTQAAITSKLGSYMFDILLNEVGVVDRSKVSQWELFSAGIIAAQETNRLLDPGKQ